MLDDRRMDLTKRIFAEFVERGSTDLLLQSLCPDAVYHATAPPGTALHGRFVGPEGAREYFRRVDATLSTEHVEVTGYAQGNDKVVVLGNERLRMHNSGAEQTSEWACVLSFQDAQISEVLVIEDLSLLLTGRA